MVDVYTTPSSYQSIDTLDDLYQSQLEIHVRHPGLLTDIFGDEKSGSPLGNLKKQLKTSEDDFLNERTAYKGDIASLDRLADMPYQTNKLVPRTDGKSLLHLVKECPRYVYSLKKILVKKKLKLF